MALLLAAGASRRFGTADKLRVSLDPNGAPMLTISARNLAASGADHLIAVLRDPALAQLLPGGFSHVICAGEQSSSLRAGLDHARRLGASRLLIALADMPDVPAALMTRVMAECDDDRPAACAGPNALPMPPACFPASWFDRIEALRGDRGAGALLRGGAARILRTDGDWLRDIDRPEDIAR
ncbi:MAG: NTP transferase domain-containing protein [Paracoccus sp. (in: a-proteobacteria)]